MRTYKNQYNNNRPWLDAEIAAEDNRPVFNTCEECGEPIRRGDEYCEVGDVFMHYDCVSDWALRTRKEAE